MRLDRWMTHDNVVNSGIQNLDTLSGPYRYNQTLSDPNRERFSGDGKETDSSRYKDNPT